MQGLNECYLWKRYKNHRTLVPILWEWNGVVCQQRVQTLNSHITPRRLAHTRMQLLKEIPELDMPNCDLRKRDNWGLHNSRIVLLDYGISPAVADMYNT